MNLDSYEARVLGIDVYLWVAKRHNLTTQKWTIGRLKEFKKEIKERVKVKLAGKKKLKNKDKEGK